MKRISLLPLLLVAIAAVPMMTHAQIQQSEFNGGTLDAFWNVIDTVGGVEVTMTGTQVSIAVPKGPSREPVSGGQGGNRAPRLVQSVASPGTDVGNFTITAKFDGVMSKQYQMQGLEAIQDNYNYVRCELFSDTAGIHSLLFAFDDAGNYARQKASFLFTPWASSVLLRLVREDTAFSQYYSTDGGSNWVFTDSVHHTMNVDSIAVYAASSDSVQPPRTPDTNSVAFTGLVDYFHVSGVVPIQLASFNAVLQNNNTVALNWMTLSETNNYGFYVQKSLSQTDGFQTIESSFIPGHGTTLEPKQYSYVDFAPGTGTWYYRLKQVDLDGTTHYLEPVRVRITTDVSTTGPTVPARLALDQNYPNPFNPSTLIRFGIPKESRVTLEVFNLIGQKVATLVNEVKPAGYHAVRFDATALTSGVYISRLTAGGSIATQKMMLVR